MLTRDQFVKFQSREAHLSLMPDGSVRIGVNEQKRLFLIEFAQKQTMRQAMQKVGIKKRATIEKWCRDDVRFQLKYNECIDDMIDEIEFTQRQCALGLIKLAPAQVSAGMFLLKAYRKSRFNENYEEKPNGQGTVQITNIQVNLTGEKKQNILHVRGENENVRQLEAGEGQEVRAGADSQEDG